MQSGSISNFLTFTVAVWKNEVETFSATRQMVVAPPVGPSITQSRIPPGTFKARARTFQFRPACVDVYMCRTGSRGWSWRKRTALTFQIKIKYLNKNNSFKLFLGGINLPGITRASRPITACRHRQAGQATALDDACKASEFTLCCCLIKSYSISIKQSGRPSSAW